MQLFARQRKRNKRKKNGVSNPEEINFVDDATSSAICSLSDDNGVSNEEELEHSTSVGVVDGGRFIAAEIFLVKRLGMVLANSNIVDFRRSSLNRMGLEEMDSMASRKVPVVKYASI